MRGLTLAWVAGLALMSWRSVQEYHKPPVPGGLLAASGVFAALALVAELGPGAARAAALTAWAFDLAIVFEIGPKALVSTQGLGRAQSVNMPVQPRSEQGA